MAERLGQRITFIASNKNKKRVPLRAITLVQERNLTYANLLSHITRKPFMPYCICKQIMMVISLSICVSQSKCAFVIHCLYTANYSIATFAISEFQDARQPL